MNECIDSTMGHIHVYFIVLFTSDDPDKQHNKVYVDAKVCFPSLGADTASRVRSNLMRASLQTKLQRVVVVKRETVRIIRLAT
jgi:hypothetical protein